MRKHLFEHPKEGGWQDDGPEGPNEHCETCGQHISHKIHYRRIPKRLLTPVAVDTCPACAGRGEIYDGDDYYRCSTCDGTGKCR